jgi:hypothetical protein
METIKSKIKELLDISGVDLMSKEHIGKPNWSEKFNKKMKEQERLISELIPLCRAQKTLLGRTVKFPMADSYALYLVTKVNKNTVFLTWLDYCDAWVDDRIGGGGLISRDYVQKQIDFNDKWSDMAEARRKEVQKNLLAQS